MSAVTRPRGPLPSRVYWFRRLLVLAVLAVVVTAAVQLLGGRDDSAADSAASVTNARESVARPAPSPTASAKPSSRPTAGASAAATPPGEPTKPAKPTKTPLPEPDGPCRASDVLVSPVVDGARAGRPVEITLQLTTLESPACTWEVSPESVFVRVTGEGRVLWASQHCGAAIPTDEVVARRSKAAEVVVRWDGRESGPGCPDGEWVLAGTYEVEATPRGSVNVLSSPFELAAAGT